MSNTLPNPTPTPNVDADAQIKLDTSNPANLTQQLMELLRPKDANPAEPSEVQGSQNNNKPTQN